MSAKVIMIQGTGSHVGKSLIVAGLCRAFTKAGLSVVPFKPQNMSNNAAATADGGEIGRAQALQAMAARRAAVADMNPVLLKPESEGGAQVIVQGKRAASMSAREYFRNRAQFMPAILESFARLCRGADLVIVEGAGSPAEVNLRAGDLANMGFARAVNAPVSLVADIHRGGVMASIVGTLAVLDEEDAARITSFIINNFHGDPELFADGVRWLEERTRRPCLGVVPHFADAAKLPAEDSQALEGAARRRASAAGGMEGVAQAYSPTQPRDSSCTEVHRTSPLPRPTTRYRGGEVVGRGSGLAGGRILVAVPRLPRIANFDDIDPLMQEPEVEVVSVQSGEALPGDADLVIIPGSKSVMADLAFLREQGWDIDLLAHVRRGGRVLGICGGYQMLGREIADPHGVEGAPGSHMEGLGLLDVRTELTREKTTRGIWGVHLPTNTPLKAYEIHLGRTQGADTARPFARLKDGSMEGAHDATGRVAGTYLHGAFASDAFRRAYLAGLGVQGFGGGYRQRVEEALDALAMHLARHLDLERLLEMAREPDLP